MRGKLRDKREIKRDHSKRETMMGRRPVRRDNRGLQLQPLDTDEDASELEEDTQLTISEEQQN